MITKEDSGKSLTHKHGGNGLAVVQWLGDDYVRVVGFDKKGISSRAYVAWTKLLTVEQRHSDPNNWESPMVDALLPPVVFEKLQSISAALLTGALEIRNTHISAA